MPYAHNGDIRIHYEVEGDGPPLVLMHGLTSDLEDWKRAGYVDAFKSDYRLILVDGRGHGKSDKPHDPEAYRYSVRALDLVAVLNDLGVDKTHFWGASMGAGIGYGVIWKAPERIDTMVLGAGQPYEWSPNSPVIGILKRGPKAMLEFATKAWEAAGQTLPEERRAEILSMDTTAMLAAAQLPAENDELVSALRDFKQPMLLYAGDQDWGYELIKRVPQENRQAEFVTLPGVDHPGSWARADLVIPIVRDFLARQGRNSEKSS